MDLFLNGSPTSLTSGNGDAARAFARKETEVCCYNPRLRLTTSYGDGVLPRYKYAVSADGQRFLINSAPERVFSPGITVVVNRMANLKK